MNVHRNAAAFVLDRDGPILMDGDENPVAVTVDGLVDAIVDDFPNEVMEAGGVRRANVHAGALANPFELGKNLDVLGTIVSL